MSDGVSQGANGVVQYEQVFVLVFAESEDECLQYVVQVGHELGARLLLERGKG